MSALPLTDRQQEAVLFRLPGRDVTAGQFVADALRLSAALPPARWALNLCTGRYAFAVGFAAALLRGQVNLLSSDGSPGRLSAVLHEFPDSIALTDGMQPETLPVPVATVPPPGSANAPSPCIAAEQVAATVFTSGSTGQPVAHEKSWGGLVWRSRDAGEAFGFAADAPVTIIGTVPPQHMYGLETTVLLPLHAPASAWCGPAFFPADVRHATGQFGHSVLVTTPLQLRTLLESGIELAPLRLVISATAPLDPVMATAAEQRWAAPVHEIYGATEVGSVASRRTAGSVEWTPYPSVRLLPDADGVAVHAAGAAVRRLEDAVAISPDGRFRLLGRRTDVIKLAGRRASLAGLNHALSEVDGVRDGAFLPPEADDHRAAARMTAIVVAPDVPAQAIVEALRDRIDPIFVPRRVVHVDRLPRNEIGKLSLQGLRVLASS